MKFTKKQKNTIITVLIVVIVLSFLAVNIGLFLRSLDLHESALACEGLQEDAPCSFDSFYGHREGVCDLRSNDVLYCIPSEFQEKSRVR